MHSARLTRVLYRELLRSARILDKRAAVKAILCPSEVADNGICHRAVMELNQNQLSYWPYESAAAKISFLFRSSSGSSVDIDAAFRGIRYLNAKLHLAKEHGLLQDIPSQLTTSPIRITTSIRRGVFLIAHPLTVRPFEQSVVLLTRHDTKCTKGVIINDDGDAKQSSLATYPVDSALKNAFPTHSLNYGGPVATNTIQFLHPYGELGGSCIGMPDDDLPLYLHHDLSIFTKPLQDIDPQKVLFVHGHASWVPTQLQRELDTGGWLMVEAPLQLALSKRPSLNLWSYLLRTLGDEHAALTMVPKTIDFYTPPEIDDQ
ncbi:hypothetical protein THRCLA_06024 [Thraustotheca clavata]|uniref:Transcriptional regulator n=1 Tax=Thraustotheca clavata TaxID=74557 RepID=A0A1V9ZQT2_9STRA|nr:hypothetical protein THRCLA_06024 [Thraustotheca clavata]